MIRKLSHIIIVLTLILSTIGITFTSHYCGNKLVSSSFIKQPKSCCDSHCNACHNKTTHLQLKENFESSFINVDFKSYVTHIWATPIVDELSISFQSFSTLFNNLNNAPPLICLSSALLQVFRC